VKTPYPPQHAPTPHSPSPCPLPSPSSQRLHYRCPVVPPSSSGLCHCLGHGELCLGAVHWEPTSVSPFTDPLPRPRLTPSLRRPVIIDTVFPRRPADRSLPASCQASPSTAPGYGTSPRASFALIFSHCD
jgi:hypothetical protein